MIKKFELEEGNGKHKVLLMAIVTGNGILVNLVGGDQPHLGAVVISIPRPSLDNPKKRSCTSSILPLVSHKDHEAALPVAEMLARETGMPVSVAAGIHVDNASQQDIQALTNNCFNCGKQLIGAIQKLSQMQR